MHTTSHAPMRARMLPRQRNTDGGQIDETAGSLRARRSGRANERRQAIREQLDLLSG